MGFFDNLLKTVTGENKNAEERAAERAEYAAEIAANGKKPWKKCLVLYGEDYGHPIPLLFITEQAMWIPGHPETAILSKNGVETKTYPFKTKSYIGSGIPTTVTKEASVVKRAVVGGVVAGGAGAVVGAISAADANAKGGVQKTVRVGGGNEWYHVLLKDFPEYKPGYIREERIHKILCFDTSKSLPKELRKALREGGNTALASSSTFKPFAFKEEKGKPSYQWKEYKPGEERKYNGVTVYAVNLLYTKEEAQNVITFIDKFAKGEETGQLLEEYIVTEDDSSYNERIYKDFTYGMTCEIDILKKYGL